MKGSADINHPDDDWPRFLFFPFRCCLLLRLEEHIRTPQFLRYFKCWVVCNFLVAVYAECIDFCVALSCVHLTSIDCAQYPYRPIACGSKMGTVVVFKFFRYYFNLVKVTKKFTLSFEKEQVQLGTSLGIIFSPILYIA